jgi:hypothetical protein
MSGCMLRTSSKLVFCKLCATSLCCDAYCVFFSGKNLSLSAMLIFN